MDIFDGVVFAAAAKGISGNLLLTAAPLPDDRKRVEFYSGRVIVDIHTDQVANGKVRLTIINLDKRPASFTEESMDAHLLQVPEEEFLRKVAIVTAVALVKNFDSYKGQPETPSPC
jgi:hypothetical protein